MRSPREKRVFYAVAKTVVAFALHRFYRVRIRYAGDIPNGGVLFVGNHPNSLIDPGLVFASSHRRITFMAKAPLFAMPVLGWILRKVGALPVYRKQDDPSQMNRNEGTFEAASDGLVHGHAVMLFPEGKSHSEPALMELRTGAARIALRALHRGATVSVVPVGLTYAEKERFRSEALVEFGRPFFVSDFVVQGEEESAAVRRLTEKIEQELKVVTLNLADWEDLPMVKTAEELYLLRRTPQLADEADRVRAFADGARLLRAEQPERFEHLRRELVSFRRRLELLECNPDDLVTRYRNREVALFTFRNLAAALFGFPLFVLGLFFFSLPYLAARSFPRVLKVPQDRVATVKFACLFVLVPLWWGGLTFLGWKSGGAAGALFCLWATPILAGFTRYFYERRGAALKDARTFLVLGNRARLKGRLLAEGEKIAADVERLVDELSPRILGRRGAPG
jgi:glycerol-3-phosphate O-acyltransferase / dihydroxyacetone phosphate acyltransferase